MEKEGERAEGDRKKLWLVGIVCALIVGLPFLNKAIHIDDPMVLGVAKQIVRDPLRPFGFQIHWFDDLEPIFQKIENPPFLSYWLAPVVAVFDASEVALHLWMLPFLILLGVATASLSRRFAGGSVWPVLFVMFSPAVVVSPNIMRDVPAAALATAAVALFVAGTDRDRWSWVISGALIGGLAAVTKYSAVIIVPVLLLYPLLRRKPIYLLGALFVLLPIGLWFLQNHLVHGKIHLLAIRENKKQIPFDWKDRLAAAMVITGSCFFLVPVLLAGAIRRRHILVPLLAIGIAALLVYALIGRLKLPILDRYSQGGAQRWWTIQYLTWAGLGLIVTAWVIAAALFGRGRWRCWPPDDEKLDMLFLLFWMLGPFVTTVFFVGFAAVRHILPAVAPVALIAVGYARLPEKGFGRWAMGTAFALAFVVQAGLAAWTAVADYGYANAYRKTAFLIREKYKPPEGRDIWFQGHWGWQHYAEKVGMKPIYRKIVDMEEESKPPDQRGRPAPEPKAGDLVARPDAVCVKGAMPPGFGEHRLELIGQERPPARYDMTTMEWGYAGFYATHPMTVPMRIVKGKSYEIFDIYRVRP